MIKRYNLQLSSFFVLSMVFVMTAFYNITPLVIALQIISFGITFLDNSGEISFRTIDKQYIIWWTLFVFYFLISYFWGANKETFIAMMISIIQVAVVGFTILQYAKSKEHVDNLLNVSIIACVVLSVRFVIQVPVSAISTGRIGRYLGTAYGNDGAAMVLCYGSLLALVQSQRTKRIIALLIIPFMIFALLTGTKLCIITFLVGTLCMLLFSSHSINKMIIIMIFVFVVLYLGFRLLMSIPVFYNTIGFRIESLFDVLSNGVKKKNYYNSSEARYLLIEYGLEMFKEKPIFGTGLDSYRLLTPLSGYYAHNNFIELLVDGGIVGFGLYYWFPCLIIISLISNLKANKQLAYPLAIMIAVLVSDIATISFNHEKTQLIYVISLCMIDCSEKKEMLPLLTPSIGRYIRT